MHKISSVNSIQKKKGKRKKELTAESASFKSPIVVDEVVATSDIYILYLDRSEFKRVPTELKREEPSESGVTAFQETLETWSLEYIIIKKVRFQL